MERFVKDHSALTTSFFSAQPVSALDQSDVMELGELSRQSGEPARYNLHGSAKDELHCMVIVQPGRTYSQPRMHPSKAKSFHLVSGDMVVITFACDGAVDSLHHLTQGKTYYAVSKQVTYHEVIAGPYERDSDDRRYAGFAPTSDAQLAGQLWIEELIKGMKPDLPQ